MARPKGFEPPTFGTGIINTGFSVYFTWLHKVIIKIDLTPFFDYFSLNEIA
jgi:hypothetical protein